MFCRVIQIPFVCILLLVSISVSGQISSTFNTALHGWTAPDADGGISYSATGGNPGGFVSGVPFFYNFGAGTIYIPFYFVAPGGYYGNRSAYYNGTLRYDVQQSVTGTPNQHAEVVIADNQGVMLYYFPATSNQPPAAPTWATYSVVFNNAFGFWKTGNSPTASAAAETQIQSILNDLASLRIRGLYRNANVTGRLDNVHFTPPIIISTQPTSTNACQGTPPTVTLTTSASGNPSIGYQWQIYESGAYTDLTNSGPFTGVTTNTLTINTTNGPAFGYYRCTISGTNVVNANTNPVYVSIGATPTAPVVPGASSCSPASFTLSVTNPQNGDYRWYTVPTGGTPISIFNYYNTPVLSATTTYYVDFFDGSCRSARTPVTVTISSPPAAPTTTGAESCPPGSVTLQAAGAATGQQYRWYTVATGGTAIAGQTGATFTTPHLTTTTHYYVSIHSGSCEGSRAQVTATIAQPGCDNVPPTIQDAVVATQINGLVMVNLEALISDENNNQDLSTLAIVSQPSSGATATIEIINGIYTLVIDYNNVAFSGIETVRIRVCDSFAACTEHDLSIEVVGEIEIYTALSPNGDGKNDIFLIEHIATLENARQNIVTIYNRWGDVVWEGKNYDNTTVVFRGLNNNGSELPTGTYFYKIQFTSGREAKTGYLSLKR
ncbi:MAG: gliding motility-associated C-terminal domain-containing protein [Cyclobacteriaceae bacterium]|nr:gliding motility-associated C-terminal domain-containing protein [Cyclobacteriaceae bacterium]